MIKFGGQNSHNFTCELCKYNLKVTETISKGSHNTIFVMFFHS